MNYKLAKAVDRAKSYVSQLVVEGSSYSSNIDLNKIWQLNDSYIVSPLGSGIIIIDQMLAHQRILYDGVIKSFESSSFSSQTLLFPIKMKFTPNRFSSLLDALPFMNKIGFNLKDNGENHVILESIPSEMLWGNENVIINQMIVDFQSMTKKEFSKEKALALSFSNQACIKHGDNLNNTEMNELVNKLFGTSEPFICPNGKSILIQIPLDEIEKKFTKK